MSIYRRFDKDEVVGGSGESDIALDYLNLGGAIVRLMQHLEALSGTYNNMSDFGRRRWYGEFCGIDDDVLTLTNRVTMLLNALPTLQDAAAQTAAFMAEID